VMNSSLLEEINRFKLLSGYDTKKTLSEQRLLTEQDKNWSVWYYDGEPIYLMGPNGEFSPTTKGTELGYTSLEKATSAYRAASDDQKALFTKQPYNKKTHEQLFNNVQQGIQQNQAQELSTNTPKIKGDKTKVGVSNLNGTEGIAQFVNGQLFTQFAPNTNLILGKLELLESFKVPVGAVPITITGTTVTPPEYGSINISFGESTMSDPFIIGKSDLKPEARTQLDEYIKRVLLFKQENGDEAYQKYMEFLSSQKPIEVVGYASRDSDPNKVYRSGKTAEQADLELSQQRANVIVDYLSSKLPELKGTLVGIGKGQTTQFGGEESGWPAPDKSKYAINRRFVINIPNFSYDKSILVSPEVKTDWEKQGTDTSGVRPIVYDERGRQINPGEGLGTSVGIEKKFASQKEIDVANQVYETNLGDLIPGLEGTKLRHYKDPNGFMIVSKEEMEKIKDYIPVMNGPYINGVSNPSVVVTSKSVSLVADGKTYLWNGWTTPTQSANDGMTYQLITDYKLVAMKYVDSTSGSIIPNGWYLGKVGFGIRERSLE